MLYPAHYLYLYLCLYLYYCPRPLDLRPLRLPFIMTIAISQCLRLEQARFNPFSSHFALSLSLSLFFTVYRYSLLATVARLLRLTPAEQLSRFRCKPRNFYARSIALVRLPRSPARSQVELRLVISSLPHFLQCTAKYKRRRCVMDALSQ